MTLNQLTLLGKRIMVKILPWDEKRGGIYLPAKARRNQDYAVIIKIGSRANVDFKIGDRCMVNRYPAPDNGCPEPSIPVLIEDEDYKIFHSAKEVYIKL